MPKKHPIRDNCPSWIFTAIRSEAQFTKELVEPALNKAKILTRDARSYASDADEMFWHLLYEAAWIRRGYDPDLSCSMIQVGKELKIDPDFKLHNYARQESIIRIEKSIAQAFAEYPDQKTENRQTVCKNICRNLVQTLQAESIKAKEDQKEFGGVQLFGWRLNLFKSNLAEKINDVIGFAKENYPDLIAAPGGRGPANNSPVEAKANTAASAAASPPQPAASEHGRERAASEMVSLPPKPNDSPKP